MMTSKFITQFLFIFFSTILVLLSCTKRDCNKTNEYTLKIELSYSDTDTLLVPRIENCTDSTLLIIRNDELRDKKADTSSEISKKYYSNIIELKQDTNLVKSTDLDLQEVYYGPGGFRLVQIPPNESKKIGTIYLGDFVGRSKLDTKENFKMKLIIDGDIFFLKDLLTEEQYNTYTKLSDSVKIVNKKMISDWINIYPNNQ